MEDFTFFDLNQIRNFRSDPYQKVLFRSGYKLKRSEIIEVQDILNNQIINSFLNLYGNIKILKGLKVFFTGKKRDKYNFYITSGVLYFNLENIKLFFSFPPIYFSIPSINLLGYEDAKEYYILNIIIKREMHSKENMIFSRNITLSPSYSNVIKLKPRIGIYDINYNLFPFSIIHRKKDPFYTLDSEETEQEIENFEIFNYDNDKVTLSFNPGTTSLPREIKDVIKSSHPTESYSFVHNGLNLIVRDSILKITPGVSYIKGERVELKVPKLLNLDLLDLEENEIVSLSICKLGFVFKKDNPLNKINYYSQIIDESFITHKIKFLFSNFSSYNLLELGKINKILISNHEDIEDDIEENIESYIYNILNLDNRIISFDYNLIESKIKLINYYISEFNTYADYLLNNKTSYYLNNILSESNIIDLTDNFDKNNNFSYDSRTNSITLNKYNEIISLSSLDSNTDILPCKYIPGEPRLVLTTHTNNSDSLYDLLIKSNISLLYTNPWYLPDDIEILDNDIIITVFLVGFSSFEEILNISLGDLNLNINLLQYGKRINDTQIVCSITGCIKFSCTIPKGTNIKLNHILNITGSINTISKLINPNYQSILDQNNAFDINQISNLISQSFSPDESFLITELHLWLKYNSSLVDMNQFSSSPVLLVLVSDNQGDKPSFGKDSYISLGYISVNNLSNSSNGKKVRINLLNPFNASSSKIYNITIISLLDNIFIRYLNNNTYTQGSFSKMVFNENWQIINNKDLYLEFLGIDNNINEFSFTHNIISDRMVSALEVYPENTDFTSSVNLSILNNGLNKPYTSNFTFKSSSFSYQWLIKSPIKSIDLSRYLYIHKQLLSNSIWISNPILLDSSLNSIIKIILTIYNNSSNNINVYLSFDNKINWFPLNISETILNTNINYINKDFYRQEWILNIDNLNFTNQLNNNSYVIVKLELLNVIDTINTTIPKVKEISIIVE